jgi:glucose/mannose-6-phosphate isomerase
MSMIDDVLAIPDHLRDALWRVESAGLWAGRSAGLRKGESAGLRKGESVGLFVCGMGGSAIGGDLAAAALGDRVTRPLLTVRGYELPIWATPEWAVLCVSYSGETEETLACFDAAEALGAGRVVVSTGGRLVESAREAGVPVVGLPGILQPRAAVAYMLVTAAEVAALAGAAPRIHVELDAAAAFLERCRDDLRSQAGAIASRLEGTVPVVYGADLTAPVARRWKTQVNENAKLPAFFAELPEADHNEICGWGSAPTAGCALSAVLLEDSDQHPRERRRFELTAEAIAAGGATAVSVETAGETRVERLLWALMLGDLVSVELADARGVDPTPVEALESFKAALGRP